MKDKTRPSEGGWYRCINPKCGKPLSGRRSNCKTCSPACRKALWRHSPTPKHLPKRAAGRTAKKRLAAAAAAAGRPAKKGGR